MGQGERTYIDLYIFWFVWVMGSKIWRKNYFDLFITCEKVKKSTAYNFFKVSSFCFRLMTISYKTKIFSRILCCKYWRNVENWGCLPYKSPLKRRKIKNLHKKEGTLIFLPNDMKRFKDRSNSPTNKSRL